jgi:hypothetical protein
MLGQKEIFTAYNEGSYPFADNGLEGCLDLAGTRNLLEQLQPFSGQTVLKLDKASSIAAGSRQSSDQA